MPKHYLHIPKNLEISVGAEVITFNYWRPRLVEMTTFDFRPMEEDLRWQYPKRSHDPSEYYPIRIYIGFDAERTVDDTQSSAGRLHVYSGKHGRLTRSFFDARGEMNVSNEKSEYSHGLTVILDDRGGNLPLNLPKQDDVFSQHTDEGVIHRESLYGYVIAVSRLYCSFFKECYFSKNTNGISGALKDLVPRVREAVALAHQEHTSICHCEFNAFINSVWKQAKVKSDKILPWKDVVLKKGKDTILCFTKPNPLDDSSVVADVSGAPEASIPHSRKSEKLFNSNDEHGISSTAPSPGQGSVNAAALSDTKFFARKRARMNASGDWTNGGLVARIGKLEDEVAQMKKRMVTQENLENEIRRLRRHMAREDKVIARLSRVPGSKSIVIHFKFI